MIVHSLKKIIVFVVLIYFLFACSVEKHTEKQNEEQKMNRFKIHKSLYIVDWEYEKSIEEASQSIEFLENILLFGTYFTESGNLFQTEESKRMLNDVLTDSSFLEKNLYLTIVNDQFLDNGTVIQKNSDLLIELLSDNSSRRNHIEQIIQYARN